MASLLCLTLLSVTSPTFATPLSTTSYPSPIYNQFRTLLTPLHPPTRNAINGSYIVMFKDDAPLAALDSHFNFLASANEANPFSGPESGLKHVWTEHMKGYAGSFSPGVVDLIRAHPEVDYIEHDQTVHTLDVQKGAPWGLARISHRRKLTTSTFDKYLHNKRGGEGVDVYVIDTGVYVEHTEFEGRAKWGKTIIPSERDIDGHGHGTHCAGIIASRKYGVAKAANIIAVKVTTMNGTGATSDMIAGIAWTVRAAGKALEKAAAELAATGKTRYKGSVVNMSVGTEKSRALSDAVNKAVDAGLHFAVAAGNQNSDACERSPASAEKAVTVGASTSEDERASFSNYGNCIDVFAPGLDILSTLNDGGSTKKSGTSMASPHTAGLMAYLLSIYPSPTFNPTISDAFSALDLDAPLDAPRSTVQPFSKMYAMTYSYLPGWISAILHPPFLIPQPMQAPALSVPKVTPAGMKKALIGLSTRGALTGLPARTVNLLIFNNASGIRLNEEG